MNFFEEVLSMAPRYRILAWAFFWAVVGILTSETGQARAQTLDEGWNVLDGKYRSVKGRLAYILKGQERVEPTDRSQAEAIDLLAKYYTYSVYLRKLDTELGGIRKDYGEFEKEIDGILNSQNRDALQPLVEALRDKVRIHALEVIQLKEARPIHKLYNARVLAKIAKLGQPALADTLITVLNDPQQNDGVRYYIFEAMGTLLSQTQPQQSQPLLSKDLQAKCAEALVTFLEQRKGPDKNASPEEIDGFRLLRREAVRALAKIHTPAFNDKVRPALVLARFAGNDERIQPPPRIDERLEAAIGLARMEPGKDKRYQADYAAGQVAKCLGAFAHMADNERTSKDDRTNKDAHTYPYRLYAAYLKDSLEAMKKISEKNMYVVQIADRGTQVLNKVLGSAEINPNEQTWWRSSQSDPPSKELFQGSADSTVKPGQDVEEK
jgi:hypothetical protein